MKNQESQRKEAPMRGHEDNLIQYLMQQQAQPSAVESETRGAQTQSHGYSQISTNASPQSAGNAGSASSGGASGSNVALLRAGANIPGGAKIEAANPSTAAIIANLRKTGNDAAGGFGANADWETHVTDQIDKAILNKLNPMTLSDSWVETRGINVRWNWRVSFRIGEAKPIDGSGTGNSEFGTGGTATSGTSSTTATTDSASVSGEVGKKDEGKVGATAGTSTTQTDGRSNSMASNSVGKTGMSTNEVRYEAPIIVETYVSPELDMSGSDYINPFKLGMFGAEAASPMKRLPGEVTTGVVRYYISNGIAPSAPAQRRGWLEHELGITEESTRNAERMQELNALDPADFSRSGAQALPAGVAQAAQAQYGASLGGVNLIHGGQADAYAQQMDAAAFTTPNAQGGSDIFVRGSVDLNSAAGQHTLQHEIAHAAQNNNGQTDQLSGLGGDPFQRHNLERDADQKADGVMKSVTQNATVEAKPAQGA